MALNNYEKAVEHDTEETTAVYKKAFKRMLDRLGCEKKDGEEGCWSVQLPVSLSAYCSVFAICICVYIGTLIHYLHIANIYIKPHTANISECQTRR